MKTLIRVLVILFLASTAHGGVFFSDNFDSCTTGCNAVEVGVPPNSPNVGSWAQWYGPALGTVGGVSHYTGEISSPGRGGTGKSFKMWRNNISWWAGSGAYLGALVPVQWSPQRHVFMRWWLKMPVEFDCYNSFYMKFFRFITNGDPAVVYVNINSSGSGFARDSGELQISDNFIHPWQNGWSWETLLTNSQLRTKMWDGNWHSHELEIDIDGNALRYWVDDILQYQNTNWVWNLQGGITWINHFNLGNQNEGTYWQSSWQAMEMDDLVLSTTPIGSGGGGGVGGDTSPPYASQWTPAKNSTGVAKTNRTITFHIQDDVDVLTANGVVNIEGTNYTCGSGITCSGNGTTDASVTYTKGSDWSYDQVVNVTTSGFRDTAGNVMSTDTWSYTIASDPGPGAPNITTTSLSSGTVGTAASQTFTATGGTSPYTWAVLSGSLPPGKTLSSSGVYSGTPTTVGTYIFTVGIVDAISGIDNQALSQVINAAAPGGQTTVTIPGDQGSMEDTWIGGNDTNYSSGTFLEVYQWPAYTWANRILDNIVMGLPDNVSISSATLYMYMESWEIHGGTNPMRVHAYRVSDNVPVISTVTGNNFTGTLGAAESYTDVPLITGWYSWNVTTMAQWAYANASPLYVALDGGQDGSTDTNRVFTSREGTASLRPYLSVTYTSLVGPPGPSISAPGKLRISNFRGTFH